MAGNVTKSEDIAAVVAATVKAFGGISTLVNNVGWGGRHDDPTAITNSGSYSSATPAYDILAYGTAKAALNQMMVSIAHMLAKKARVNSVLIGTVMTAGYGAAGIDEAMQEKLRNPDNLTGRPGGPKMWQTPCSGCAHPPAAG